MFDSIHVPELQDSADDFIKELCKYIFMSEIRRTSARETVSTRRYPGPLFSCFLEALPHALVRKDPLEIKKAQKSLCSWIKILVDLAPSVPVQEVKTTLYQIALRFSNLCLEDSWELKKAGCNGIYVMTELAEGPLRWLADRALDMIRVLLHVLKDMPFDLPEEVQLVMDVLTRVLKVSWADFQSLNNEASQKAALVSLVGAFFGELSGQSAIVRRTAQDCIEFLVKMTNSPLVELLLPHRDRMLTSIYTKPLRALPFPIQIGMIDAVRYCLSMDPPLPELNDELLRLLHEALALADADDNALMGRNASARSAILEITKLRVACIKVLTASMPLTDFFSKQHQTRQRYECRFPYAATD